MEVFTSACFILMLYCSEWLGLRQCYAFPVPIAFPTLLNYYDNSANQNWNWKYKQLRTPGIYHDKFVFPSKEPVLNIAERSGGFPRESVKIVFPDETEPESPSSDKKGRPYQFSNSESSDAKSAWRIRQENQAISDSQRSPLPSPTPTTMSPLEKKKHLEREKVAAAVQDWYSWYVESKKSNSLPSRRRINPTNRNPDSKTTIKGDPVISDQSLVAGLQNQKCPEGQIRLDNGECRVNVEI